MGEGLGAPKSVATTTSSMMRRGRHGDDDGDEAGHRSYPHSDPHYPTTRSSRRSSLRSSPCFPKNHPSNPHFNSHSDPHFDPHPDPHSDRWLGFSVTAPGRVPCVCWGVLGPRPRQEHPAFTAAAAAKIRQTAAVARYRGCHQCR